MVAIRELKRRYKTNLALQKTLPTFDLATPLPLSTGNPLYDGALLDKLVKTRTMDEASHTNRAWGLVRRSSLDERRHLADNARGLLNDYKLLLALQCWDRGELDLARSYLHQLPWRWKLAFPMAVIKPASTMFTGWRTRIAFRLVDNERWDELRELFRQTLASAPGIVLLKYRNTIQASAALLKFRFEGDRERAIHDLAFGRLKEVCDVERFEPIPTYLDAKAAYRTRGIRGFLDVLQTSDQVIPITSFMGMLGNANVRLFDDQQPYVDELRSYAIRCATAVESLLRLVEWSSWLDEDHVQILAANVKSMVIDRGLDVPFFKVVKAYLASPLTLRQMILQPLFLPLLEHYGTQVRGLIGEPGPMTFVQPGNVINLMSFLLYTVVSTAMPARLCLLYKDGVEDLSEMDLDIVSSHLADDRVDFERWLLSEFGGLTSQYSYTYDYAAAAKVIGGLNPDAPLMLDMPFAADLRLLESLLPCERIFNLNGAFGAPGEICLSYDYYLEFGMVGAGWDFGVWSRTSDRAATKFTELLDRLHWFDKLAEVV